MWNYSASARKKLAMTRVMCATRCMPGLRQERPIGVAHYVVERLIRHRGGTGARLQHERRVRRRGFDGARKVQRSVDFCIDRGAARAEIGGSQPCSFAFGIAKPDSGCRETAAGRAEVSPRVSS
jgi:hypothetical protein